MIAKREEELKHGQDVVKKLKVGIHDHDVSIIAAQDQIKKYEKQLSDITSKKEYDALRHEIAGVKERIKGIEEETLASMLELEAKTGLLPALEEAVKKAKAETAQLDRENQGQLETCAQRARPIDRKNRRRGSQANRRRSGPIRPLDQGDGRRRVVPRRRQELRRLLYRHDRNVVSQRAQASVRHVPQLRTNAVFEGLSGVAMCLLAIFFRAVPDAPLVIGANREEAYGRGGEPPRILPGPMPAIAGRDPVAGGTWLGVNACGVVVAVTNRPIPSAPANARSRGVLARELLDCATAKEAVDLAVQELSKKIYAGCNLFCGDRERAVVIEAAQWLRIRPLPPGLHVLANRDINDGSDFRVLHALNWLSGQDFSSAATCVQALKTLCSQSGDSAHPPICLHGQDRGTVSSTILAVRQPLSRSLFLHAQGSPDTTQYADLSALFQELAFAAEAEGLGQHT